MDLNIMSMPKWQARAAFIEYRDAILDNKRKEMKKGKAYPLPAEYETLMTAYKAMSQGRRVINVSDAITTAGLDAQNLPRIAVCRADAKRCQLVLHDWENPVYFVDARYTWDRRTKASRVNLPRNLYSSEVRKALEERYPTAIVPLVPPKHMPPNLSDYYILWEANWVMAPVDPVLLKRLTDRLFAVVAQWDLTPIEQSVLGSSRTRSW